MSRHYYSRMNGLPNTCSIRSLKKAYIGNGVRMTSDKNTVEFVNVPMQNLKIKDYNKMGFRISHVLLPKEVWVDFDQLPLTRLQINNGFITDEITFVENIVNHKMQLIRTLDTEYVDMIYKEKALDQKQDEIIPITQAVPGQIYIGAQCEEGNEMIYLGTFFVKETKTSYDYNYYRHGNNRETKTYMHKLSPARAFFAVPSEEVTQAEEKALNVQYYGNEVDKKWSIPFDQREVIEKKISAERKKILANSVIPRFKVLEFPVTSKRIKQLIITHKENKAFANTDLNKAAIIASIFSGANVPYPAVNFQISNNWYAGYFLSTSKETIETEIREFYNNYTNVTLENCYYEDRYNKQ